MTLQRKFVEGKARWKVFLAGGMAGGGVVRPWSLQGGFDYVITPYSAGEREFRF